MKDITITNDYGPEVDISVRAVMQVRDLYTVQREGYDCEPLDHVEEVRITVSESDYERRTCDSEENSS